jgi:YbbR domain-containing protein
VPKLIQLITRNLLWKLVALVAAVVIWINVSNEPELATDITVPVEYNNLPQDLDISSPIVDSIHVEARGPSGQLRNLHDSRIAVIIDFATVKAPGQRTFTVTGNELKLPRGIQLIRTTPAQLRFTFENHETREVPVNVAFSGKIPDGFSVASVETLPASLSIAGPRSRVDNTPRLNADPFDLSNVTADTEQTLAVYAAEPEVRIVSKPQVRVKVRVAQRKR